MSNSLRSRGSNRNGGSFSEAEKRAGWNKGQVIPGYDSTIWRKDRCGATIKYSEHGNTNSQYGWEIDHIYPVSKGGTDDISNLQPLHWENNREKADNLTFTCKVTR